jgi:hypothetical protein
MAATKPFRLALAAAIVEHTGMLPLAALAFALGLALLSLGLRGRSINDHPICRRCKFDLIGNGDQTEKAKCPECGSTLSGSRSIQRGSRARRPVLIVLGVFLLLAGAGGIGALQWARATKYDWNKAKPAWLLLREAQQPKPDDGVLKELRARLTPGRLSADQTRRLIDRALAVQADSSIPWSWRWGDIIEFARPEGLVSDAQWSAYASNAKGSLGPAYDNPFSRHAGKLYIQPGAAVSEGRGGLSLTLRRHYHLDRLTVGGVEVPVVSDPRAGGGFQLGVSGGFGLPPAPAPLSHGDTEVESFWTATIAEELPDGTFRTHAQWTERVTGTWNPDDGIEYPQPLQLQGEAPERTPSDWRQAVPLTARPKPRPAKSGPP